MAIEVFKAAFPDCASPRISYNLSFPEACAKHITEEYPKARIYAIVSGTLSARSNAVQQLKKGLGKDRVVGIRRGVRSHTFLSEVLEIMQEVVRVNADLIVTLGAGSLTDAAKLIVLVRARRRRASPLLREVLILMSQQ